MCTPADKPGSPSAESLASGMRKRPVEEELESEDEPPVKRRRSKPKPHSSNGKPTRTKREPKTHASQSTINIDADTDGQPSPKAEEREPTAVDAPVERSSKTRSGGRGRSNPSNGSKEAPSPLVTNDGGTDNVEGSSGTSQSDAEELDSSSEEEKPEIAAKAREKVQSTLKATGNDPFSDWKAGEPVPYAALCTTFSKIEMTTKRLEILAHCSLFLRQVLRLTPQDLLPTVLLMINKLAADYSGVELGIGESLIMKAIGESTGRSLSIIKADQNEIGDLGLVAAKSRSNQPTMFKPKALTVRGVHEGLMAIATVEGQGAQSRKIAGIKRLLSAADAHLAGKGGKGVDITKDKGGPSEAKFIVRTLEGKLRLGLADKTVLVALAQAVVFHELSKSGSKVPTTEQLAKGESILKSVYRYDTALWRSHSVLIENSELPSYEVVIPAMLEHGISNLRENCKLQPGVPLKPMLAKPTKSITEVLDRFEGKDFTCEYKYDGERAQIHFVAHDSPQHYATTVPSAGRTEKGISNIFSRNSEDLSKKYPDILEKLPTWVKDGNKSFVLDCETVAWDVTEKKVLPFQQLMTRKRKDVKTEDVKVKVCVFAFDLLFLNGEVRFDAVAHWARC